MIANTKYQKLNWESVDYIISKHSNCDNLFCKFNNALFCKQIKNEQFFDLITYNKKLLYKIAHLKKIPRGYNFSDISQLIFLSAFDVLTKIDDGSYNDKRNVSVIRLIEGKYLSDVQPLKIKPFGITGFSSEYRKNKNIIMLSANKDEKAEYFYETYNQYEPHNLSDNDTEVLAQAIKICAGLGVDYLKISKSVIDGKALPNNEKGDLIKKIVEQVSEKLAYLQI
jgi:hypothetical protein